MSDATNAPAIIAAWESIANRFEAPGAEIKQIGADMAGLADSMGDFACGKEGDAVGGTQMALQALGQAYEGVQAEIQGLYDEFAASIEAAAGKGAVAHAPMQEA